MEILHWVFYLDGNEVLLKWGFCRINSFDVVVELLVCMSGSM
jgi:hypothetical protein